MLNELENIQIQAVIKEKDKISKEVRSLRIVLDNLREENSKIIEKLTYPEPKKLDYASIFLFCSDWMTSINILKIIELKHQIHDLESKLINKDSNIILELTKEFEDLVIKRDKLLISKQSLEDEYSQLIEENSREKEQLKAFLSQVK